MLVKEEDCMTSPKSIICIGGYLDHIYRPAVWRWEEGTEKACRECYPATFVTMNGQDTSHLPLPPGLTFPGKVSSVLAVNTPGASLTT